MSKDLSDNCSRRERRRRTFVKERKKFFIFQFGEKRGRSSRKTFHLSLGNWRSITFFAFREEESKLEKKKGRAAAGEKRKSHHILSNFVGRPQKFLSRRSLPPFFHTVLTYHFDFAHTEHSSNSKKKLRRKMRKLRESRESSRCL